MMGMSLPDRGRRSLLLEGTAWGDPPDSTCSLPFSPVLPAGVFSDSLVAPLPFVFLLVDSGWLECVCLALGLNLCHLSGNGCNPQGSAWALCLHGFLFHFLFWEHHHALKSDGFTLSLSPEFFSILYLAPQSCSFIFLISLHDLS